MVKALISWSSGKDAAWALHVMRQDPAVEVVGLLTTINREFARVAMHAVRRELLDAQAAAVGLPLWSVEIPHPCSQREYEVLFSSAIAAARSDGVDAIVFGDLFLEDIRRQREDQLAASGVTPLFPLWKRPTAALATEMLAAGVAARVTCVERRRIPAAFAGARWDDVFIDALPSGADPCGENGEFHTFAFAGPMFNHPLGIEVGQVVTRDDFVFADLLPATHAASRGLAG